MKFGFVVKHRHIWPISWMCEVLAVSRSGFHAWLRRLISARASYDAKLVVGDRQEKASRPATAPMALVVSGAMCWKPAFRAACTRDSC